MTKAKTHRLADLLFAFCGLFFLAPGAKADDFGKVVHLIESEYHVHRNYRFLMSVAGVVVKCSHVGGVKTLKAAIFDEQHLDATELDSRLDELVAHATASGWRPLVKSFSRRRGEYDYVYAQASGKDLKLLVVSVEPDEAVVLEVKLDPLKLSDFINAHAGEGDRNRR
jgi:hypothetical protein